MKILDRYIDQLLEQSTPEAPIWNLEKIRAGAKPSWNYMDGCVIKAILELYLMKKEPKYLEFADNFIDYFVQEDGSILSYDPKEYNLDNVNAGKTLFDLYNLTHKEKYRKAMDTIYSQLQGQPRTSRSTPTRSGLTACTWLSPSICSMKSPTTTAKAARTAISSLCRYTV